MASSVSNAVGSLQLKSFTHGATSAQKHDSGGKSDGVKVNQGQPRPATDYNATKELPGEATKSKLGGAASASKGTMLKPKFSAGKNVPESPRTPGFHKMESQFARSSTGTPSLKGRQTETTGQTARPKASDVAAALKKSKEDIREAVFHPKRSAPASSSEGPKTTRAGEKDAHSANSKSVSTSWSASSDKGVVAGVAHATATDGHPATPAAQLKTRSLPAAGMPSFTKPKLIAKVPGSSHPALGSTKSALGASNPGTPAAKSKATGAVGHSKETPAHHSLLGRSTPMVADAKSHKVGAAPKLGTTLLGGMKSTTGGNHESGTTPAKSNAGLGCKTGLPTKIATPAAKASTPALKFAAGKTRADVMSSSKPTVNGSTPGEVAGGNKQPVKSALWRPKVPADKEPVRSESIRPLEKSPSPPATPIQQPETGGSIGSFGCEVPGSSLPLLKENDEDISSAPNRNIHGTEDQQLSEGYVPDDEEEDEEEEVRAVADLKF